MTHLRRLKNNLYANCLKPLNNTETNFNCKLTIQKRTQFTLLHTVHIRKMTQEIKIVEYVAVRRSTANRTTNRSQCQSAKQPHEQQSEIAKCARQYSAVVGGSIHKLRITIADGRSITVYFAVFDRQ